MFSPALMADLLLAVCLPNESNHDRSGNLFPRTVPVLGSPHPHPNPVKGDFRALHFFQGHFLQHWREPRRPILYGTRAASASGRSLSANVFQAEV